MAKLEAVVSAKLASLCMRLGMFALSCWLAKHAHVCRTPQVGVYPCRSVASWTDAQSQRQEIYPTRTIALQPVPRVGYQCKRTRLFSTEHRVTLPAVSLNLLRQVEVIGGSEMIFTPDGMVLYDELALGDTDRYSSKVPEIVLRSYSPSYLPAANRRFVQCLYYREEPAIHISRAISLLKDYSNNYYHWLLECLPRAIIALREPALAGYPFLIDAGLPSQIIESLRLLSQERQHILVPKGLRVLVQELSFPSVFSSTHDYYGTTPRADDFLIAPEAISLLRKSFLSVGLLNNGQKKKRLIYVARSGGAHRSITNENEVILALEDIGFTIVYPGKLSFVEQISMFADAEIIVGPTGAGMANIVFSRPTCKIAILAPATRSTNYYVFSQIAQHLNLRVVYVGGKPRSSAGLHSHYHIRVNDLKTLISEFNQTL